MGMNKSTAHISPEDRERILSLYRDFTSWRSEKFEEEDYTQARALISYKTKLPPSAPEIDQFICYMAGNNHAMIFEDFDGQKYISLHSPNTPPNERIYLVRFKQ